MSIRISIRKLKSKATKQVAYLLDDQGEPAFVAIVNSGEEALQKAREFQEKHPEIFGISKEKEKNNERIS